MEVSLSHTEHMLSEGREVLSAAHEPKTKIDQLEVHPHIIFSQIAGN